MSYSDLVCELRDSEFPFPEGNKMKVLWRSMQLTCWCISEGAPEYPETARLCSGTLWEGAGPVDFGHTEG